MQRMLARTIMGLAAALALSPMAMAQGQARGALNTLYNKLEAEDPGSGGPAPKHDIIGVWTGPIGANEGEIPPLTPAGQKLFALSKPESKFGTAHSNDPLNTCDPLGMPRSLVFETRGLSFAQMPGKIVILQQYQRVWRDVWMDGRQLPKNIDTRGGPTDRWYGYSVGHWDGDYTLVVETTGINDETWVDNVGHPHSINAHIEERYTRVDHNHLELTVTMDDPKLYTKPFVLAKSKFRWVPDQEQEEQMCIPSEAITYSNVISAPAFGGEAKNK